MNAMIRFSIQLLGILTLESHAALSEITHGPFIGHVTPESTLVWARFALPGTYTLSVTDLATLTRTDVSVDAKLSHDLCVVFPVMGLTAGTAYSYIVESKGEQIATGDRYRFTTPRRDDRPTVTRLAFGSCAREDEGSAGVWRRMAIEDPHAVVLLGDTPYIDSTDLAVQRKRYREFAAVPDFANLLRSRPLYATWDDHDFGRNDTDGKLPGKESSRQAFIEYHANPFYGEDQLGNYSKFRLGGVEVYLLDTRYFAGTELSPVDESRPTLLGHRQWKWLKRELMASTAPFKLIASGMIWNGAVRPTKQDHWATYRHERDALFHFIGQERISGVVLVGGDIHRSRVLRYDTTRSAGYKLTELITSPIHEGIIEAANAPHPSLVFDAGQPHAFLLLTVDTTVNPATLSATFENSDGDEFFSFKFTTSDLSSRQPR